MTIAEASEPPKKAIRRFRSAIPANSEAMAEREHIAKKLRDLREAKHLSQAGLAKLVDMAQSMIGRFETAKRSMRLEHAMEDTGPKHRHGNR